MAAETIAAPGQGAVICPLDHDVFRSGRPKNMNVIDSNSLERDAGGKPHTLFLIPL
ncbi:hypothetical protein GOA99_18650 [Sinorhizobium meliloti]|nr:hypothetical protein [Sinorhizobium meliloti]